MWFQFYALVNLARITLDTLRNLLRPVFATEFKSLPKSISDYLNGGTDCPVYVWIAEQPTVKYLCDIRNCIVHFRTFATGDNAIIVKEGLDEKEFGEMAKSDWVQPMARGVFRRVGERGVSVNFYLPDVIFAHGGAGEKLVQFTYEKRYNVLSMCMDFVRLVSGSVLMSLLLLFVSDKASYHFIKPKK